MKTTMSKPDRWTVSVVTGGVVARDAISNVCRQQIEELDQFAGSHQICLDLKLFLHGSNIVDPRIVQLHSAKQLACEPHFQKSDLVLFHFGIYYPLFDALPATPRSARLLVNYYGITPPALTPPDFQPQLYLSFQQATHLLSADRVIVNSRFIRDEALAMGVRPDRLAVLPLPAAFPIPTSIPQRIPREELRIAYLGRIVAAKGLRDLLSALRRLTETHRFQVKLMGARQYSSAEMIREVEAAFSTAPLAGKCELLLDLPGDEVRRHLAQTDLFVMPSHHEGFCVPIIEAISCGAGIISTTAGALPETSGGLGLTYPPGDSAALHERLCRFAKHWVDGCYATDDGAIPADAWVVQAANHLQTFQRERFRDNFLRLAVDNLQCLPAVHADLIADSRVQAFRSFHEIPPTEAESGSIGEHLLEVVSHAGQRRRVVQR